MSTDKQRRYENIIVEKRGQVDWVTLNRAEQLNSLNAAMIEELSDYFDGLYKDHDTRIVVLKAAGRAFCAGLDLSDYDSENSTVPEGFAIQTSIRDIMKAMRRCPQPIISLLHGPVCGGGFTMALASDIRIAADDCRMNAAFIKIGLSGCDMGSSYFLPRLVGTAIASELLLTGRFIHAARALRVNLVSEVVTREELDSAAEPYINEMLATSPMGLRLTKEVINFSVDLPSLDATTAIEDRQQILLAQTEDHAEAVSAFFERRKPNYQNK